MADNNDMFMTTEHEYIVANVRYYCGKIRTTRGIANEYSSITEQRREDIIRCHDCKYYEPSTIGCCESDICNRVKPFEFEVQPDGFCAWAKKKDEKRDDDK